MIIAEYIDKNELDIAFIEKCTGDCSCCSYWDSESCEYDCKLIHNFPTADVVERDKINKAIEEIEQTLYVDSLIFGELIDFKDGKISADDVIEEFNRVTRIEVLEILKRNIGE